MSLRPLFIGLLATALLPGCERRVGDDDTGFGDEAGDRPWVSGNGSLHDTGSVDTGDPEDTGTPIDPGQACYPGPSGDGTLCLQLVVPDDLDTNYDYPEPYQGSADYRPPVAYLDLSVLDPATKLAPNFRLDEFAAESKGRYAVVQPHAVASIQDLRDTLGPLGVNSGYRSPGYNDSVDGSATWSRHTYGDAADLDPVDVSLDALHDACLDSGAGYVGVYVAHIHCDWRDEHVDTAFFGPAGRARSEPAEVPFLDAWIARTGDRLEAPAEGWDEGEPLREWYAYDADGVLLDSAIAETWVPPEGTDEVVVVVGRAVTRSIRLVEL